MRIVVTAALVLCCSAFFSCSGTRPAGKNSIQGRDSSSTTVELYGVAEQQSEQYTIPFIARDGKAWYREATPGLTLADVLVEKTSHSTIFDDSEWMVQLHVKETSDPYLKKWSEARVGGHLAFFVDGKPGKIVPLYGRLHQYVFIPGLWSETQAQQLATRIRSTSVLPRGNKKAQRHDPTGNLPFGP